MEWSVRKPDEFLRDSIEIIRKAAPKDFPAALPVYGLRVSALTDEVRGAIATNCDGCTGALFDLLLRPVLESRDEWRGPGLGFIVADRGWLDTLLVSMHELAHCIDLQYVNCVEHARSAEDPGTLGGAELAGLIAAHYAKRDAPYTQVELNAMHGRRFVRTMGHLWHRVNAEHYLPTWFGCDLPAEPDQVLDACSNECQTAMNEGRSIGEALELPEPAEFRGLWGLPEVAHDSA